MLEMLSVADVRKVHQILVADFESSQDPISPPGVRSRALLESAVGRQWSGHGQTLKYPDPIGNAATLAFGICMDHPFHNGNKRTALVCLLVHLDKNRLCLFDTSQSELYQFMVAMADHTLGFRPDPRRPDKAPARRTADDEVDEITRWLRKRVSKIQRGERAVTFRTLRSILGRFRFELANPHSNSIEVVRVETSPPGLLRRQPRETRKKIGTIGYRDEGTQVSIRDLKALRKMCGLTEDAGVDADSFYNEDGVIDAFINRYRGVLRRLAKT